MSHLDDGLLTALVDNELDEGARRVAEAHLAECGECRRLLEEVKVFAAEADGLVAAVELPPKRVAGTGSEPAGAGSAVGSPRERASRMPWRTLAWAASVLLAAGLGWTASDLHMPRRPTEAIQITAASPEPKPAAAETTAQPTASVVAEKELARTPSSVAQGGAGIVQADRPASPAVPRDETARLDEVRKSRANEADLRGFADAAVPAPAAKAALQAGNVGAAAALESPRRQAGLRQISMEDAVRSLGGSIRLLDGLQPVRILIGPPPIGSEFRSSPELIRVVYLDPPGRELWLDQQRPETERLALRERSESSLLAGDTVFTSGSGGSASLRWVDHDFRLALTGFLGADSLRALMERVH